MKFSHLESAECTDTGRKRKHNEDSLIRIPGHGVYCVADGMGGTFGGEIASQAAVEGLQAAFDELEQKGRSLSFEQRVEAVRRALNDSSRWIRNHADEMGVTGTGTTAIILIFDAQRPDRAAILHAGDSRAYKYKDGKLTQLSMDHSVAAAAGMKSDKALPAMFRGVVTRAVGLEKDVLLEETLVDVAPGDLFMLCSDGLNKMVPDKTVTRMIKEQGTQDLAALAKLLVDAANAAGGEDNTSVVLIRVAAELPAPDLPGVQPSADATAHGERVTPVTNTALPSGPARPGVMHAERKSDPEHFSGITPVGETDTPTAATSEFQKTRATMGPVPDRQAERESALQQIAAGKRQHVLMVACAVAVFAALAFTVALLLKGHRTTEEPALRSPAVPVVVQEPAPGPESPPESAMAPDESAPEPIPAAPVTPASAELEAAHESLRVDVLETLMTGQWGELDARAAELASQFPGLGNGAPEWATYETWIKEWKKAEFGAPPAPDLFAALRDAAAPVIQAAGGDPASIREPVWKGEAAADADAYCSAIHSLRIQVNEFVEEFAVEQAREAAVHQSGSLPLVTWIEETASEQGSGAADALAMWITTVANLIQSQENASAARMPPTLDQLRDTVMGMENVEKRKDEFFDRLVDLIRGINVQKAGWNSVEDPAVQASVYELGIQRVRIVNVRARYRDDVRKWRTAEGQADVLKFLHLVDATFPKRG
ncbi:MAG: protein phosphatase 2C domain-containing protein [bacterium]